MNPEEARLILQCRRPQGQDDALPAMAEAMEVLATLPEAQAALESDAALDALIGAKLRRFAVPAQLRHSILTGARITPRLAWWRRRHFILSAAAVLAVGWSITLFKSQLYSPDSGTGQAVPSGSLAEFREAATIKISGGEIHLNKVSSRLGELQAYLASRPQGRPVSLPEGLTTLPTHGCEVFEWQGHEVTLICFETAEAGIAHLFTIDADALPADLSTPLPASVHGWETLTWKQDGKVMLLTAQTSPATLRRLALPG
ncbi:MAG: hypothetical protein V4675_12725 [Verrucomicrobiota bacterium]